MSTTIEIDNILHGYNDFNKIPDVYSKLRKEVFPQSPIQKSPKNLVVISTNHGGRNGSYEWELYVVKNGLVLMEAFGSWDGYGKIIQPRIDGGNKQFDRFYSWHKLKLTLHPGNSDLENKINNIISEFPRDSKKAS